MTLAYLTIGALSSLVAAWTMRARSAVQWLAAICLGVVWPMALVMLLVVIWDGCGRDVDEEDDHDAWS